eukprot:10853605-Alexandrium_andersonii.AAC.1
MGRRYGLRLGHRCEVPVQVGWGLVAGLRFVLALVAGRLSAVRSWRALLPRLTVALTFAAGLLA